MKTIHLLHSGSEIEIFYTLFPFVLFDKQHANFLFKKVHPDIFDNLEGDTVLFTRIFKNRYDDPDYVRAAIGKLKKNFNRVYFLDDSAGADSTHFEFIDLLDGYYKTKLLKNFDYFTEEIYGRQIFSDYYHNKYNVKDEVEDIRQPIQKPEMTDKLQPAFNLGFGFYPKPEKKSLTRYTGAFFSKLNHLEYLKPLALKRYRSMIQTLSKKVETRYKTLKISARFRYKEYPNSIGYQRYIFHQLTKSHPDILTGFVSKSEYDQELKKTIATLSPFGYGEVCFRDFESVLHGSLLLKPDMGHLVTHPNIYIPNETYIPLKWDGSDLLDKADNILSNPNQYFRIAENARRVYKESLLNLKKNFRETFKELF